MGILAATVRATETWVGGAVVRLVGNHLKIIAEQAGVDLDLGASVATATPLELDQVVQSLLLHFGQLNLSSLVESRRSRKLHESLATIVWAHLTRAHGSRRLFCRGN